MDSSSETLITAPFQHSFKTAINVLKLHKKRIHRNQLSIFSIQKKKKKSVWDEAGSKQF